MSLHPVFGPWSIIIERLVGDVSKFLVILTLFILTFTFHHVVIYKQGERLMLKFLVFSLYVGSLAEANDSDI